MICFFGDTTQRIFALQIQTSIDADVISKLSWLFGDQPYLRNTTIDGVYVGMKFCGGYEKCPYRTLGFRRRHSEIAFSRRRRDTEVVRLRSDQIRNRNRRIPKPRFL